MSLSVDKVLRKAQSHLKLGELGEAEELDMLQAKIHLLRLVL